MDKKLSLDNGNASSQINLQLVVSLGSVPPSTRPTDGARNPATEPKTSQPKKQPEIGACPLIGHSLSTSTSFTAEVKEVPDVHADLIRLLGHSQRAIAVSLAKQGETLQSIFERYKKSPYEDVWLKNFGIDDAGERTAVVRKLAEYKPGSNILFELFFADEAAASMNQSRIEVWIIRGSFTKAGDLLCTVSMDGSEEKTTTIKKTSTPEWGGHFTFPTNQVCRSTLVHDR